MEPTPELRSLCRQLIGPGATDNECDLFAHSMLVQAEDIRAVLLPFERAAKMRPEVRAAVELGKQNVERLRATDERLAARIGADKPAYQPKRSWALRVFSWLPMRRKGS